MIRARKKTSKHSRTDAGESEEVADTVDPGHRFRTPSKLHDFNRYELKYLVPTTQNEEVRAELASRMHRDRNAGPSGYGVWSLYYDTDRLRFCYEKIEGLKFRRKLRIRRYGELGETADDTRSQSKSSSGLIGSPRSGVSSSPTAWLGTCAIAVCASSIPTLIRGLSMRCST